MDVPARNLPARRFYEARGFLAIKETDGEENEAREPDVLYRCDSFARKLIFKAGRAMPADNQTETVTRAWARLLRAHDQVFAAVEGDLEQSRFPPVAWYDVLLELAREGRAGR